MKQRRRIRPTAFAFAIGVSVLAQGRLAAENDVAAFGKSAGTFLQKYCLDCHGDDSPEGDISLAPLVKPNSLKDDSKTWERVFDQLTLAQMPPEGEDRPDDATRLHMVNSIEHALANVGVHVESKLVNPGYGNYVKHHLLFENRKPGPSFSPPRLWRVRPAVYDAGIQQFAKGNYPRPFNLKSGGHGFRDYANQYKIAGPDLNQLIANTKRVVGLLTTITEEKGKVGRGRQTPQQLFTLVDPSNPAPTDEQLTQAIDWLYHRALLRDATEEERERLITFARHSMKSDGQLLGIRNMVSAVLLKPEAFYRSEQGAGEPDEHGRVLLTPRELAYAISYALTDSRPDQTLLKAADDGQLASREAVAAHVQRLLDSEKIAKPRVLGFFREYFEYGGATDVFKDAELFRSHAPEVLVNDTDQLIMYLYERDRDVLRELLTTRKSFVQFARGKKGEPVRANAKGLGAHLSYNLPPDWKWIPDQPIDLPGDQRAGVLTQPSWLVAKSGNFDNDAIRRGLWIRNKLLAGTILDVPITVDAQLPNDESLTLRERMKVTQEEYCWKCHYKTNPVGLPFEQFDHFGRWRTKELGEPVDTTGAINASGERSLDSEVKDAIDLIHKLADSDLVRQVFVRHAFRYWMGRNETLNDAATLQRADEAYLSSGGSMKALITSLLTSDSFLYRKET